MEAVIFSGLQATGKTTFYKERFLNTHIRISLDMLRTRQREALFLRACFAARQPFVVDNTNITREQRQAYIEIAKKAGFKVVGYYFQSEIKNILRRNQQRTGKAVVPKGGIFGMKKRLQAPTKDEGFDELFSVSIQPDNQFLVEKLP
jgi:predicted kinase